MESNRGSFSVTSVLYGCLKLQYFALVNKYMINDKLTSMINIPWRLYWLYINYQLDASKTPYQQPSPYSQFSL